MKIRVNVSASLFRCKHCDAEHNNRFTHACVVPFSELAAKTKRAKRAAAQGKRK